MASQKKLTSNLRMVADYTRDKAKKESEALSKALFIDFDDLELLGEVESDACLEDLVADTLVTRSPSLEFIPETYYEPENEKDMEYERQMRHMLDINSPD